MKLSEVWASYETYTGELTKHSRQIAFGGVAISWLLRSSAGTMPRWGLISLGLLVVFFLLDVLQYFVGAWRLRTWMHGEEHRRWKETGTIEGDYDVPRYIDRIPFVLFNVKIVALLLAYVALGIQLFV